MHQEKEWFNAQGRAHGQRTALARAEARARMESSSCSPVGHVPDDVFPRGNICIYCYDKYCLLTERLQLLHYMYTTAVSFVNDLDWCSMCILHFLLY